jgi:NAD(P)-dependent dehydrogenase (short-subunit alcohol dehydrogenase family)
MHVRRAHGSIGYRPSEPSGIQEIHAMSALGLHSLASLVVLVSAFLLQSGGSAPSAPPSGKGTVLVTGANRGIGLALAKEFRAAGYEVIGTARNPEEAKELAATGARVVALDVTSAESVRALAERLKGQPIDILVNNAGVGLRNDSIDTLDIAEVERVLAVNTIGPMRVTQALLPNLRLGSRKVVASISSRLASIELNTSGDYIGYRESKTALNQFMRTLSVELKGEGFICVALSPGWVRTDMGGSSATLSPEESAAGLRSVIEGLTPAKSGSFFSYDGATLPW